MAGEGPEAGSGEEWALMGVIPAAEGYSISIGNRSARSLIKITAICQFLISRTAYFDIVVPSCASEPVGSLWSNSILEPSKG